MSSISDIPGATMTAAEMAALPFPIGEVGPSAGTLRPLYVIRRRFEEAGLWSAMSVILVRDHPDKLLKLLSTETTGMIDVSDPDVIAMVQLVGADPAVILA